MVNESGEMVGGKRMDWQDGFRDLIERERIVLVCRTALRGRTEKSGRWVRRGSGQGSQGSQDGQASQAREAAPPASVSQHWASFIPLPPSARSATHATQHLHRWNNRLLRSSWPVLCGFPGRAWEPGNGVFQVAVPRRLLLLTLLLWRYIVRTIVPIPSVSPE